MARDVHTAMAVAQVCNKSVLISTLGEKHLQATYFGEAEEILPTI